MAIVILIVTIILQLVAAQILGFGGAMALGVGDGVELFVIPVGYSLGVWGVGALAARIRGQYQQREMMVRLVGTAVCAAVGVGLILITPAFGFGQLLFLLAGAFIGYYAAPLIRK